LRLTKQWLGYIQKDPVEELDELRRQLVSSRPAGESYDPTSMALYNAGDDEASGLLEVNGHFDKVRKLGRKLPYFHICQHAPRALPPSRPGRSADNIIHQNENAFFDAEIYKDTLRGLPGEVDPVNENLLQQVYRQWNPVLRNNGYPGGVDQYLQECEDRKYCLQGSVVTQAAQRKNIPHPSPAGSNWVSKANHIDYSDHVTKPADNPRAYVGTSLSVRLHEHRTKPDRCLSYGHGRKHGKRATVCIIEGKFDFLLERVGLSHRCHPSLASSILPLQIHTIDEATFPNNPGVVGTTFVRVYENYAMLP